MNRRRQHPAAAAARRARFFRAGASEERETGYDVCAQGRGASPQAGDGGPSSSRGGALSEQVDGGAFEVAEDAA